MSEQMHDPFLIRWSQKNIGEEFRDGTSIFDTYEQICAGMEKRTVPLMHVTSRGDHLVTLDNRRLAVYKMARRAGKCGRVKVLVVPRSDVSSELRWKSDSTVEGQSVAVRGTDKTIHADGSVTTGPALSDGELENRANHAGHWTPEQLKCIVAAIRDIDSVVKEAICTSARVVKAGSFMKGTDIGGESDVDVMVFGCGPITAAQWERIVDGIKGRGHTIQSTNPRCIHVNVRCGVITIEFDVVAKQRQGFPPNAEPMNPFKDNRIAAHAVRNIKLDLKESGDARISGNQIETAVLDVQGTLRSPGLGKLIDAAKAKLRSEVTAKRDRPLSPARENKASRCQPN